MERGEAKGESAEQKKQELKMKVKKLKKGGILVGKRSGPSTPSPIWRLEFTSLNRPIVQEFLDPNNIPTTTTVSARKLCATLWDIHPQPHHHHTSLAKMPNPKSSHFNHNSRPFNLPNHVRHPPTCSPHPHPRQPESASGSRRHLTASLMKHHESVERNGHALQPVSPASYDNSMEVAAYNPAVTPTSSLDSRGKLGKPRYNLKTSTELLTVLNRIWSLEEQHVSDIALVKALKMELDHSQTKIKELLQEKQTERQEVNDLMKQVAEEKIIRKDKERNRIKAAVQSWKDELEDERKLRKCSESLHRKLARDLSDMKSSFSNILKELERERKARILLENLCDEFAKGIRDYEEEVRLLRHKPEMDHAHMKNADRLILHISESWLDERMQMKIAETQNSLSDKNTILDKLRLDIENFLQAKHFSKSRAGGNLSTNEQKKSHSSRHSTESFPLNEAVSAPRDTVNEESTDVDLQVLELNKSASRKQSRGSSKQHGDSARKGHLEELVNSNSGKKKVRSRKRNKGHNLSSLQGCFHEHVTRTESQFPDWERGELEGETGATEESKHNGAGGLKLNHVVDDLIRNHSLSSEGDKVHPETDLKEDSHVQSLFTGHGSPVQKWMSKLTSPDFEKSESSLKVPRSLKVNTLKEKLLEARLEAQHSCSKPSKSSF